MRTRLQRFGSPIELETGKGERGAAATMGSRQREEFAADYERPSIKKKILAFRAIASQGLYRSRFGLPNAIIPFVTVNEVHLRSMMKVVEAISNGHGSKLFIFKSLAKFRGLRELPAAHRSHAHDAVAARRASALRHSSGAFHLTMSASGSPSAPSHRSPSRARGDS